ncbi:MAG: hypothetical protein ABI828_00080 [Actinomycetota bacterium]
MSEQEVQPRGSHRGVLALAPVLAVLLAGLAAGAFLFLRPPPAVSVDVTFKPGETLRFHMIMNVSGVTLSGTSPRPAEDEIQADVTWRVVTVDPSGTALVVQTVSDPTMTTNGLPTTLSDLPPTKIKIGADGQVRASTGVNLFSGGAPGPAQAGIARPMAFLPGHPVAEGDIWRTQASQAFWGSALSYASTSQFLRREMLDGVDAAVIETRATVPVDVTVKVSALDDVLSLPVSQVPAAASASYSGSLTDTTTTSWVDPATGSLLKTVSRGTYSIRLALHGFPKSVLTGDGTGTLSGELSMELTRV